MSPWRKEEREQLIGGCLAQKQRSVPDQVGVWVPEDLLRAVLAGQVSEAVDLSLGRRDGLAQFTDGNDRPFGWVVTGRAAARIKESIERFVVVGFLRLERLLPGTYAWRPAPGSRGGSVAGPAGKA